MSDYGWKTVAILRHALSDMRVPVVLQISYNEKSGAASFAFGVYAGSKFKGITHWSGVRAQEYLGLLLWVQQSRLLEQLTLTAGEENITRLVDECVSVYANIVKIEEFIPKTSQYKNPTLGDLIKHRK